jgi:branched-chain amino acid transport system substrate-binding protein
MLHRLKPVAVGLLILMAAATGGLAQPGEPIKIGFGMAQSGPLGPIGKQALLGMKIWEEQTNAKGGLLGRLVKLIYYDDQSNPSTVPGIYAKLIDVDKVGLILGGYATNQIAPAMPVAMARGKVLIGLFGLAVNTEFKYPKYFAMIPTGPNPKPAFTEGFFEIAAAQNPKPETVALAAADSEFALNSCEGARGNARKYGFKIVYDRTYPPTTTEFTPIVRAVQAANPDLFVVCSYPLDSVGMVKAVNEIGYKPKMFGGSMVGLQAFAIKNQLRDQLNGIVNSETWVPANGLMFEGTDAFFKAYQARAGAEGVDPLGYFLGGWGYAYIQVLGDAVSGANSLDDNRIAEFTRANTFKTIMGHVKFGADGEWATSRMLQVQYHSLTKESALDAFRGMETQTVLTPSNLKSGDVIYPYEKAK